MLAAQQIDELTSLLEISTLGVDIIVKAAIWGHGGQTGIDHPESVFIPQESVQLNIFGYAMSGTCSLGNTHYISRCDHAMRTDVWPPTSTEFEAMYNIMYQGYVGDPKLVVEPQHAKFAYIENYGDRREPPRGNKLYYGARPDTVGVSRDHFRVLGVTDEGPLLRIYQIIINGRNILSPPHIDIHLHNSVSLNEIIHNINLFFTQNEGEFAKVFQHYGLRPSHFTKLIVNLLDISCNYTEEAPTIGAVTTKKR